MRRVGWTVLAAGAVLLAAAGARGGVDADLIFHRVTENRVTETGGAALKLDDGGSTALPAGARVLVVECASPRALRPGEFVSAPQVPGDNVPLWFLVGADAKQVERLASGMEVWSPEAVGIGGIGTCTLYTPCPKCRSGAEEILAKRKVHPPALRVREASAGTIRPGQFLIAADLLQGKRPLVVLEDERTGKTLNRVRSRERLLKDPV